MSRVVVPNGLRFRRNSPRRRQAREIFDALVANPAVHRHRDTAFVIACYDGDDIYKRVDHPAVDFSGWEGLNTLDNLIGICPPRRIFTEMGHLTDTTVIYMSNLEKGVHNVLGSVAPPLRSGDVYSRIAAQEKLKETAMSTVADILAYGLRRPVDMADELYADPMGTLALGMALSHMHAGCTVVVKPTGTSEVSLIGTMHNGERAYSGQLVASETPPRLTVAARTAHTMAVAASAVFAVVDKAFAAYANNFPDIDPTLMGQYGINKPF